MKDIRVLVTGVGSTAAVSECRCFKEVKERNIYVVGTDIKERVPNLYIDKYYQNRKYDDPDFIKNLVKLCKKEKIDFLFPLVDGELYNIAKHREDFSKVGTIVCLNDADTIELIQNKYSLYKYLENNNIDVPKCVQFSDINEFIDGCKKLGFPNNDVCYKPPISSGSRGFRIISNNINVENYLFKDRPTISTFTYDYTLDLMKKIKNFPTMMLMEYLPGVQVTVDAFAIKGELKKIVLNIIPEFSNIGVTNLRAKIISDRQVEEYCKRIITLLNLDGYFGMQLAYSKDNVLKLMEINPRIQGSAIVTHFVGNNLPYFDIKYRLGEEIDFSKEIKSVQIEAITDFVAIIE